MGDVLNPDNQIDFFGTSSEPGLESRKLAGSQLQSQGAQNHLKGLDRCPEKEQRDLAVLFQATEWKNII
jgi:hypothetical protein